MASAPKARKPKKPYVLCELLPETRARIDNYIEALKAAAPTIGAHGLDSEEFWSSGIFRGAIESIRGTQAASMDQKRKFMLAVLDFMKAKGTIKDWSYTGDGDRHDYQIRLNNGRLSIVEAKGCLDGNNTNIFVRPPQADEFLIWSLCQNPASDPRHNVWSGLHTRLGAEMIVTSQKIDGVIVWDMVCGSLGRPCPKLKADPMRATEAAGHTLPPPCLYLFPRSIPDARNNPKPAVNTLTEVGLLDAFYKTFKCQPSDVVEVVIEARMKDADFQRRTILSREGKEFAASEFTTIKRVRK
jgi:hypothetical protein